MDTSRHFLHHLVHKFQVTP